MRRTLSLVIAVVITLRYVCVAAAVSVSDVTMHQSASGRDIVVSYSVDAACITTFQFQTNGVAVAREHHALTVAGAINTRLAQAGSYQFVWHTRRDLAGGYWESLSVVVKAWPLTDPPPWCAVGLVGQELPVRWYAAADEVPLGIGHSCWKRDWLLLRKLPASRGLPFVLGAPSYESSGTLANGAEALRLTELSKPFYIGIYEVTQMQWQHLMGSAIQSTWQAAQWRDERPAESLSYEDIRGVGGAGYDWPSDGHQVGQDSFMGRLRARTADALLFDLPTEAQWEYACRSTPDSGWVSSPLYNGTAITNQESDASLATVARYKYGGGFRYNSGSKKWETPAPESGADAGTALVGSYAPNAWGLYDMLGNVYEWCLDWYSDDVGGTQPVLDPPGASSGTWRVLRGGSWLSPAAECRVAFRNKEVPNYRGNSTGLRVVGNLLTEAEL